MTLHPEWKRILWRAWSIRFLLLAGVFTGLEVAMPLLADVLPVPKATFAILSGIAVGGAFVTRLIAQKNY